LFPLAGDFVFRLVVGTVIASADCGDLKVQGGILKIKFINWNGLVALVGADERPGNSAIFGLREVELDAERLAAR
jgi:hypothetical protein